MYGIMFLGIALGILGLAGPAWKKVQVPGQTIETPAVVMLKITDSMLATDIQPTRLERAKFKLNDLIKADPRARMALVGYSGTAHTIVPLTTDYEIIASHLDGLSPSVMPRSGNNLEEAFQLTDSVFAVSRAPGTVILILDELTETEAATISQYVQNSPNQLFLYPFNVADRNPALLRQLAQLDSLDVYDLTLDDSDVNRMAEVISENLEFTELPEAEEDTWRDAGWMLSIPLAIILLAWFRQGWVLILLITFSSCDNVHSFRDLWYTTEFQAQKLSDEGEYRQAADLFKDPMRKGVALYKAGDFEAAASAFAQDTTANGAYNKGLAYMELGDLRAAKMALEDAVELDPDLAPARESLDKLQQIISGSNEVDLADAQEAEGGEAAENTQNSGPEDLSGGGQEATKEDMEKERQEETVSTDIRMGKELDEVPDDIGSGIQQDNSKILMRKVDDDPSLFLKRKFEFQVKEREKGKGND